MKNDLRDFRVSSMKKALLIASVLFVAVISTACINNIAVQELNNKANSLMQKGDYEAAMNRLQASLDLDSTIYETYYNLGIAATNAKKYDIAINALQDGIKIKPDFSNFYYSLAVAQAEYIDSISELNNDKKELSNEDKNKIEELKMSAIKNAQKYLELSPAADDKEDIEKLIKDLSEEKLPEEPTLLKG